MLPKEVRRKIQLYKKNKMDISDLIKGRDISGEDLSGTIIKKIDRFNEDLRNINFSGCIIGEEGATDNLCGCNLEGSNFKKTVVNSTLKLRKSNCKDCNFSEAFLPFVEYQNSNFRGCNFCDAVIRVGSRGGHGAIIEDTFLYMWGLIIKKGNKSKNKRIIKIMEGLGWTKKQS